MKLYHYSSIEKDSFVVSPKKFGDNYHSNNEVNASSVPRTFFYLNPKDKESFFNRFPLYVGEVSDSFIYDLGSDPANLKSKGWTVDKLLKNIKTKFKGVKYNVGFDIVSLFVPLEVERVRRKTSGLSEIKDVLEVLVS